MNVKRAVAAAAGVIGTLILVAAVGVGYLTGHHSSTRPGVTTVAHATAVTQSGTASTAAPVKATLDTFIYGDSLSTSAIYGDSLSTSAIFGDGLGVSVGTATSGDGTSATGGGTSATGGATGGTTSGDGVSGVVGVVTLEIYGD